MSLARALERDGDSRWSRTKEIPLLGGGAVWRAEDREALREYLEAREAIAGQPEAVPDEELPSLAARLHESQTEREERKRIVAFLASRGGARATQELQRFAARVDPDLRAFLALALEEASGGAPGARHVGRQDPCPCGGGRKFKDCCAGRLP